MTCFTLSQSLGHAARCEAASRMRWRLTHWFSASRQGLCPWGQLRVGAYIQLHTVFLSELCCVLRLQLEQKSWTIRFANDWEKILPLTTAASYNTAVADISPVPMKLPWYSEVEPFRWELERFIISRNWRHFGWTKLLVSTYVESCYLNNNHRRCFHLLCVLIMFYQDISEHAF